MTGLGPLPRADLRLLLPALLAWAAAATLLGTAAWLRVALGLGMLLIGLVSAHRSRPTIGAYALVLAVVLATSGAHGLVRDASGVAALAEERAVVTIGGEVSREPYRVAGQGHEPRWLLEVDVDSITARGRTWSVSATVLVRGDAAWSGLHWHDRLTATGRLATAPSTADRSAAAFAPQRNPRLAHDPGPILAVANAARRGLRDATEPLPPDAAGLLPGLVVGDTSRLPDSLSEDMKATGMTHLSAVSGTNTTLVLVLTLWLLGWLRVPRAWRPWVSLLALAGFVVLARPEPSVLRAAVMGGIGLIGLHISRGRSAPALLGGAVTVLLCLDPWLARSFGFTLSTLATLGLIVFARPWSDAVAHRTPRLRGLGVALAVPAAASLVCAPVIVLLQGGISLGGVLANALAAPLVAPATIAGLVTTVLAPLGSWAVWIPVRIGGLACSGLAWIAHTFARLSWTTIPWPDSALGAFALAGVCVALVVSGRWLTARARGRPVAALALVVLSAAGFVPTTLLTWPPPGWRIVGCDVGQGDAIVLRSALRRAVVVDAGPDSRAIDACLDRLGVDVVDAVVLTHFHADHVDGLAGVGDGRAIGAVLVTPILDPRDQAAGVRAQTARWRTTTQAVWAGDSLSFGWVRADVLAPIRRISTGSVANNASVVLSVSVDGIRALLLGDVEREAAAAVHARLAGRHEVFDVVKVAHHGSANFDDRIWDDIRSNRALISVGADNDYGHPAPRTLAVLRRNAYAVHRTDLEGDVAVVGPAGAVRVVPRG